MRWPISTLHYLQAVQKVGSDDPAAVQAAMRDLPFTTNMLSDPRILENGRVIMDLYIAEVKSPKESKGPHDLYNITDKVPAEKLFTPAAQSGCAMAG